MNKYLLDLEDLLPKTKKEYLQDIKTKRACEKTIELAIESVISVISMIVSEERLGIPESEDDLILLVELKEIISRMLAQKIRQMKGFRNILVHRYGTVNDSLVYQYLLKELDDFTIFEREINIYIKNLK
ncbi:DUF86 domain-containing protein [Candidatus Woesearchaeota archaeon]|nr:DUF86 domain-containing protein [Candidatus Woesearchaeota archaeon]